MPHVISKPTQLSGLQTYNLYKVTKQLLVVNVYILSFLTLTWSSFSVMLG